MSFQRIEENSYYYESSVNIGYVHNEKTGMMIDAGLDRSSVKKVVNELTKRSLPLTHLLITHAHADHYGGASYIQKNFRVHTIAPGFEEIILKNPELEPIYLFGGNDPLNELQNKFLQGPSVRIDEVVEEGEGNAGTLKFDTFVLPGHSYNQIAIRINDIIFSADAYFGEKTLYKHGIPYVTDVNQTLNSLKRLKTIPCKGMVPGHGPFEHNAQLTIDKNIKYHQSLLEWLYFYIEDHNGVTHEKVIVDMCDYYNIRTSNLSQWLLYRTAVSAYLVSLIRNNYIDSKIIGHRWTFFAKNA